MSTALRGNLYVACYAIGVVFFLLINVVRRKIYGAGRLRAAVYAPLTFLLGFCGAVIIGPIYNLIAYLKGFYPGIFVDVLGAVIFTSPFLLAAVNAEKAILKRRARNAALAADPSFKPWDVSFRDTMDLVIPGAFVVFAFIKLGCAFRGCCWGVECSWGFTAQFYYSKTVFPVQAFESATLFAIAAASHFIQFAPFYRRGMSGPFAAFLYGAARFFWEFFRWNPPEMRHFFLGVTIWQLLCILVLIVAGVWIYILIRTQPREPRMKVKPLPEKKEKKKSKQKKNRKTAADIKEWLPHLTPPKQEKTSPVHNKKRKKK